MSASRRRSVPASPFHGKISNPNGPGARPGAATSRGCGTQKRGWQSLTDRYETIVCEDLNVAGMIRNQHLARAIADQGFGTARRMLGYETTWNAGRLILADRFYPSSKTCSGCGALRARLRLSERSCDDCGLVADRDVNAAGNLLGLAASAAESLNDWGGCVRPGPAGRRPLTREPGTAHAGRTGTVAGQPVAAGRGFIHAH